MTAGPYREKSKWMESGSVVMQTEEYRYQTQPEGCLELVLVRNAQGTWMLSCAQLWSGGHSIAIAPSDTSKEDAQQAAIVAAHNRLSELIRALPLPRTR